MQFLENELENQKQKYQELANFTESLLSAVRDNDLDRQKVHFEMFKFEKWQNPFDISNLTPDGCVLRNFWPVYLRLQTRTGTRRRRETPRRIRRPTTEPGRMARLRLVKNSRRSTQTKTARPPKSPSPLHQRSRRRKKGQNWSDSLHSYGRLALHSETGCTPETGREAGVDWRLVVNSMHSACGLMFHYDCWAERCLFYLYFILFF